MLDDHDRRLLSHVRPPDWHNPRPAPVYDLLVIGGGTAGLVCAAGAAGLGARVALVERARLGGDCLNTGCVPSKALLRSARVVAEVRAAGRLGIEATDRVDFAAVMARLRARRADIAPHDSAARLASLGVDVFFGDATFTDGRTTLVTSCASDTAAHRTELLRFRKAVIATGSRPAIPEVPGLRDVPVLTSENAFELREQPRELIVLGGGPIGCELAQAFALLGSRVTLLEMQPRVLSGEDPDASAVVAARLAEDGVDVRTGVHAVGASAASGRVSLQLEGSGTWGPPSGGPQREPTTRVQRSEIAGDALLVAVGRSPNVEGLGLDAAGVRFGSDGVTVNDRLRTSSARIYASGDVCSRYKFTHAADALSRLVIQNALFFGRRQASSLVIPWCTFTSPEVAHVGANAVECARRGASVVTIPLADVDRAVVDDATEGFVRIHHDRGRILGATVVAPEAGEVIGTIAFAMQHRLGLASLSSGIVPYPTYSLALRQAGDAYRRTAVTPLVRSVLHYYFKVLR